MSFFSFFNFWRPQLKLPGSKASLARMQPPAWGCAGSHDTHPAPGGSLPGARGIQANIEFSEPCHVFGITVRMWTFPFHLQPTSGWTSRPWPGRWGPVRGGPNPTVPSSAPGMPAGTRRASLFPKEPRCPPLPRRGTSEPPPNTSPPFGFINITIFSPRGEHSAPSRKNASLLRAVKYFWAWHIRSEAHCLALLHFIS